MSKSNDDGVCDVSDMLQNMKTADNDVLKHKKSIVMSM